MGNRIQAQVIKAAMEENQQRVLEKARDRILQKEKDALYKYVRISNGVTNLRLLCQMDEQGNLLPSEIIRINRIKKILRIK